MRHIDKQPKNARVFCVAFDDPTILDEGRWLVYANVTLIGEGESRAHNDRPYLIVCSPEYLARPAIDEQVQKNEKYMTMEWLDKEAVESKLKSVVSSINRTNPASWEAYYSELSKYLNMDE